MEIDYETWKREQERRTDPEMEAAWDELRWAAIRRAFAKCDRHESRRRVLKGID